MTSTETTQAMREGKKVRYHSWWWGHWIEKNSLGKIVSNQGATISAEIMLSTKDGWELYDEEKHGRHNEDLQN